MRRITKRRLDPSPPADREESDASSREDDHESAPTYASLSTMLLKDWAWGRLYGTEVQRYAHAAFRDGLKHTEVEELSKMGSWGRWPSNVHQQLPKKYLRDNTFPEPVDFDVHCRHPQTLDTIEWPCSVLLPHETFSCLYHSHPEEFREMMGLDSMSEFWGGASRDDPRLKKHPV